MWDGNRGVEKREVERRKEGEKEKGRVRVCLKFFPSSRLSVDPRKKEENRK